MRFKQPCLEDTLSELMLSARKKKFNAYPSSFTDRLASVPQSDARPTGDQEFAGSIPAG